MAEVLGRRIHFDCSDASRKIFRSIIISRYSVRDSNDEVLRTDDGLALVPRGQSRWQLNLAETVVLVPSKATVGKTAAMPVQPDLVEVRADWQGPGYGHQRQTNIRASDNANVFDGLGALYVPDNFHIPVVTATPGNVRHYDLTLLENREVFEVHSDSFDMILTKYRYARNYQRDFLLKTEGGGGYFVETHHFPHVHIPLRRDCDGFIIIGRKTTTDAYQFTAFRIPYGNALYTPANVIHGDGTINGEHAITVATSTAKADTVLFYNASTGSMAKNLFPDS